MSPLVDRNEQLTQELKRIEAHLPRKGSTMDEEEDSDEEIEYGDDLTEAEEIMLKKLREAYGPPEFYPKYLMNVTLSSN